MDLIRNMRYLSHKIDTVELHLQNSEGGEPQRQLNGNNVYIYIFIYIICICILIIICI